MAKTDSTYNRLLKKSIFARTLIEALKTKSRIVQVFCKAVLIALMLKHKRAFSIFSQSRRMLQALVLHLVLQIVTTRTLL